MDFATLSGLIIGVTVVTLAIMTGSDLNIFLNLPGFLIVVGGTFAATMIKFPLSGVFISFPVGIMAAFTNEKERPRDFIKSAIRLSKQARKSGLLSLENVKIKNPFFRKGVRLCADGRDLDYIRKVLTQEMALSIQREEVGARVFLSMGDAAPAFGMFGTLVGLVQMLSNMKDPTTIGGAMAVALLTTLYGVLMANLIALTHRRQAAGQERQGTGTPLADHRMRVPDPTAAEPHRHAGNTGALPARKAAPIGRRGFLYGRRWTKRG